MAINMANHHHHHHNNHHHYYQYSGSPLIGTIDHSLRLTNTQNFLQPNKSPSDSNKRPRPSETNDNTTTTTPRPSWIPPLGLTLVALYALNSLNTFYPLNPTNTDVDISNVFQLIVPHSALPFACDAIRYEYFW